MNHANDSNNQDNTKKITDSEVPWLLIESYFKDQHLKQLVRHQIESYNYFVTTQIENTIEMFNPLRIFSEHDYIKEFDIYRLEILITFENFNIHRPQVYENNGATKIMFPQEARLRNFTYAGAMTVDFNIKYIIKNGENYKNVLTYNKNIKNVHIGKLPIMLRSDICVLNQYKHINSKQTGECNMDPGGYFIINGSEKTCLGQERAAENQIFCFNIEKKNTKWSWLAEMKSIPDWKCISPKQINLMITSKNNGFGTSIYMQIPRLKNPIPLFIVFRALNIISDQAICQRILLNINDKNYKKMLFGLKGSIVDANTILTYDSAIRYIVSNVIYTPLNVDKETGSKRKYEFALEVINNDIFPHCKTTCQKIYMLGYMTNILLRTSFGWLEETDRDSYLNKRIDLTGTLLNNLLRNYLNKVVKDMQKQIIREINNGSWKSNEDYENIINNTNIYKIVKSTTIENGIKRALATGDFGIKQINSNKVGVAQVLNRLTYISSISHLRRVNTPIDKSGKLVPPRRLHNSSWGFLCPAETPEGGSVGIVKNLSYMTHITINSNSGGLYDYILPLIISIDKMFDKPINMFNKVKIFINGNWVGITENPIELYNNLKDKKYKGIINIYTSIIFDYNLQEIKICNDAGRLSRPVIKVENNKLIYDNMENKNTIMNKIANGDLNWNDLLYRGKINDSIIEYIDSYEQNNSMIAMEPEYLNKNNICNTNKYIYKYTHCEIHPSTIFGILASCIPFPENNQSPRNTYQSAMGKQAIGMYVTNFDNRMDKTAYVLSYPMRPLVDTRLMNIIKLNNVPSGEQVIVAIISHTGYNQEDSILFNKSAIDRGLFLATIYHTEKDEDKKLYGNEEIRCKPDKNITKNIKFANYEKVNNQGVIPENTLVEDRDVIISKILPIKENRNDYTKTIKYTDESRVYRTCEETYIDKNYIDCNGDGYNFCKVRLRNYRKPVIGDKFCIKEDSYILTNNGWIQFKNININIHKVATLINGENLEYIYPINKYQFSCVDEELYSLKSQYLNIVCTINHKLYVKTFNDNQYNFIEANNIYGKKAQYKKNADNLNCDVETFNLETLIYKMDDFIVLLGYFIIYGWIEEYNMFSRINIRLVFSKSNILKNALSNLNIIFNIVNNILIIDSRYSELINYFDNLDKYNKYNKYNKSFPDFVWNLSKRQCNILLNTIVEHNQVNTSYLIFANDVQRLALHCGYSAIIKNLNNNNNNNNNNHNNNNNNNNNNNHRNKLHYHDYCVIIYKSSFANQPKVNYDITNKTINERYIMYTGNVGCIEVPDTHLFYYKDDLFSPPCWTGNSSRHGQKGTIGNIIPEHDMPFTADGLKPDIIINPHAIPSRMTIAQLKETLLGKVLIQLGLFGDGTSFCKFKVETIRKELQKLGYESNGNELMYNGLTGEQFTSNIFIGPAFYQRLKHMVNDKQHSRSIGPMVNLTRQPAEGRARDGGLRFGEMERDCMISHGASRFTKGRLYDASDAYSVHVCNKCGMIASFNNKQHIHICRICDNRTDFKYIEIPYSCKLMFQELLTMNIAPRIMCD